MQRARSDVRPLFYGEAEAAAPGAGFFAAARNATMLSISGARVGIARIAWVLRLGVYPGGYARCSTRASTSSRDDPAIGGPWLPGKFGSALWQTTQLVI